MPTRPAILITGAARRLGAAMARHLAAQGYDLVLHYHRSQAEAEALAGTLFKQCTVHLLQADLQQPGSYDALIAEAVRLCPQLSGMVHNASLFHAASLQDSREEDMASLMQLHVMAPYFLSRAYAKQIGKGSMVMMLDTYINRFSSRYFAYLLSKKALAQLVPMLARELAPAIRVNAVAPGLILPSQGGGEAELIAKAAQNPMQRTASADEVAATVYYLLGAAHLTGQILYVDGGEQWR